MSAEVVFWCAGIVIFYTYLGYPLLLAAVTLIYKRPVKKAPIEPSVSLLVAAYNEEDVIEAKVRDALAQDYPADRLEIVVASDGSKDATNKIVGALADGRRVRLMAYPENRGKVAALNDSVPALRGEIVAFSDASSMLGKDAIRRLAENFADPEVGAVSGVYQVRRKGEADFGEQEDFYWKYETFLKVREARLGSVLGAHGSLYAIRKRLYPYPKPGTINDDYVIPVRILGQGFRTAYETSAIAYEDAREMGGFSRRVRVMAGNFEQLRELAALVRPPRWFPLFVFLSHKVGRLIVPAAMVAALASNAFLLDRFLYSWLWWGQVAFYAMALLGVFLSAAGKMAKLPYYFCLINLAAFCGIYYALSKRHAPRWKSEDSKLLRARRGTPRSPS